MERALNPELLGQALGQHDSLPSVGEVSNLIAQAELASLLGKSDVDPRLIETAWYLHAVASSKHALRVYGLNRQRAAFSVAGHIFDLATKKTELDRTDKLKYCFAAQIAYLRSNLDPNAIAIYNQEAKSKLSAVSLFSEFTDVSLCCGVAFLGFDVGYIYNTTKRLRAEISKIETEWGIEDIFKMPCGSAAGVALATRDLMTYLLYGKRDILERSRETLRKATISNPSAEDQISRWVAAHLLNLSADLEKSSVWEVLPSDSSPSVAKAFVMGRPKVLTLWPPQIELLKPNGVEELSPLSIEVKRLFLSTPTSSGKTLIAQLLIASHFSTQRTSVFYIAPTRSLCREVRIAIESRLRFLGREIVDGLPEGDWLRELVSTEPIVEVMTPERLSYLLRSDSEKVLSEVGLFIFDEVHNIGDSDRGWILEQDLAYLHYATSGKSQRIVLMSAAVGNDMHFVEWMNGDSNGFIHRSSEWRGPRRIHAIYTTEVDWNTPTETKRRGNSHPLRLAYPVYGKLSVRLAQTGDSHSLKTANQIGVLAFKATATGSRESKEDAHSTPFYELLVPIITHFAQAGPVLIIESTREATVRMARSIAGKQSLTDVKTIKPLLDLVEARLGAGHPLLEVLQNGIAYHHGSLPSEIRTAIEEAVTNGFIKFLVATTTMTEGVNLPVRSVVIASQGSYRADGYDEYITGSKLINAIGRAGRATKETEGIVVLARRSAPDRKDFERLNPKDEDLKVISMLATPRALEELAQLEESQRNLEDAIFEIAKSEVSDFLSFVWFIASELEKISNDFLTVEQVGNVLSHTLGWTQLKNEDKIRWLKLAGATLDRYKITDEAARRRWAASGTSISSVSKIEVVARSLANSVKNNPPPEDSINLARYILSEGRLAQILEMPEAPKQPVYMQRKGKNRTTIDISVEELLIDWMSGTELLEISQKHFGLVRDLDHRFEQLGDTLNRYFEIFFPWVFGTIVSWANKFLSDEGDMNLFPRFMSAYVRWGVSHPQALELMSKGLSSRTLAMRIANSWVSAGVEQNVLDWLRSLGLPDWQNLFSASGTEIKLLLEFCRDKKGGPAADWLLNETTSLKVDTELTELPSSEVSLSTQDDLELSSVGVWLGPDLVGKVTCRDQNDVQMILSSGLDYSALLSVTSGIGTLRIDLVNPAL